MEKQKKRKKHIFLKIFLILTLLFVTFIAVGNFLYDEYGEYASEEYEEYDYFDEYYDDEYSDDGYYGYEDYDIEVPENTNLKVSDYALGTCGEMEGTTLLVSVFLNDSGSSWDNSASLKNDALKYTGMATDWISKSTLSYGCNSKLLYNWNEYSDLYYEGTVDTNMLDVENNPDYVDVTAWRFIDENIDSKALLEKYNADNIGYMFYLNTPKSNKLTSCTRNFYEGMAYPYEMCFIYMFCEDEKEAPAGIAHEILHTFGAPDLYRADTDGDNYGVSKILVKELERTQSNDIMFTTYDAYTNRAYYDHISNDFTDVDAYYVGIIDSCDFVTEWNLKPSQHR